MPNRDFHLGRPYIMQVTRRSALSLLAAPLALPQDDVIKVDVERVNVLFSVRDRKGAFVNSLTQSDIEVREDGKPQEIRTFARESDLPLTIGLLIDVSISQQRLIEEERQAGAQFFRQILRQKDMAFLISFGSEAELLQDSTGSAKLLERALGELRLNGPGGAVGMPGPIPQGSPRGTILYDAVYLGAKEKLETEVGRKALILITDGVDQGSRVKMDEAIRAALRSDALIYGVYYVDPAFYGFGYGGGGDSTLRRMAEDTGGRFFRVERRTPLDEVFRQIEEEMRSQYALSYSSSNPARDGGFRKLEIKTKNKEYRVQARKGYFAPMA